MIFDVPWTFLFQLKTLKCRGNRYNTLLKYNAALDETCEEGQEIKGGLALPNY